MNLTEDEKKYILTQLMKIISNIANKEYQRRVWINGLGPEVDDFCDTVNFFYDYCDMILPYQQEYNIIDKQYLLLVNFKNIFEHFANDHNWAEEFIESLEWKHIMDKAKEVLIAFNYKDPTSSESG